MTGPLLLALGIAVLALDVVPGSHRLGLPPLRLAGWGLLWLAGSALTVPVLQWPVELSVNAGGATVPLAAAALWLARARGAQRRRGLWAILAVAAFSFALLRVLAAGAPPFVSPAVLAGVATGVVASLFPVPAPAAVVAVTAGMVLAQIALAAELALAALPAQVTVAGAEGYDALVIAALTAAGMSLLGDPAGDPAGDGSGKPAGDRPGEGAGDPAGAPAGEPSGAPAGGALEAPPGHPAGQAAADPEARPQGRTR